MALTKAQLEALKNSLLASQQPIIASTHRELIQNVINEMYDAQSRGNLLAGVQQNGTTTTGDTLLLIRSGEMFLVPTSLFGSVGFSDARYLRKDITDTKTGDLTLNDSLLIPTGGIQAISSSTSANNDGSFRFGEAGLESFRIGRDNVTGGSFGTNQFLRRAYFYDRVDFRTGGLLGTNTAQINTATGRIFHQRSGAANESIRRDEQRLLYLKTITTAGTINSLLLQAGIFNYRFTAATSITGFDLGEIGLSIIIQNSSSATLTLVHESGLSSGGMRIRLIGGSNLVIPIEGKVTLIYVTENRWELLSKNF
jgi:hypothetical protein